MFPALKSLDRTKVDDKEPARPQEADVVCHGIVAQSLCHRQHFHRLIFWLASGIT